MAPEIKQAKGLKYEGPPVDIFACGVMLFMMYTGSQPFSELGDAWHRLIVSKPEETCTRRNINDQNLVDLVGKMLVFDPNDRITFE
jgi:serine/threonine protein kinase